MSSGGGCFTLVRHVIVAPPCLFRGGRGYTSAAVRWGGSGGAGVGGGCLTPVICHAAADGEGVRTNGSHPRRRRVKVDLIADMKHHDTLLHHRVALELRYAAAQR